MGEIFLKIYGKRRKTKNVKLAAKHKKNNNFNLIKKILEILIIIQYKKNN